LVRRSSRSRPRLFVLFASRSKMPDVAHGSGLARPMPQNDASIPIVGSTGNIEIPERVGGLRS
jgi:hypothetical protein